MNFKNIFYLILLPVVLISFSVSAQQNNNQEKKPRVSPKAEVMQTIGITDVKISYGRPGVKNRKIWGELVPYNKVWRAGANEATKITFSTDVTVEGKKLQAGSYSFFIIPNEREWTVIFNKVADQWGAFEYNEAQDALRIKIRPAKSGFHEWLYYHFSDMKTNDKTYSAILNVSWESVRLPLKIETKVP